MKLSNIEMKFIYDANVIVELYECRMTYCDPDTRTILIEGSDFWQAKCYSALTKYFKDEREIEELKEIEIFLDNAPKVVYVVVNNMFRQLNINGGELQDEENHNGNKHVR